MHRKSLLLLAFLAVLGWAQAARAADLARPRNVLIIGWDGCRREHLKAMIARNETPNLAALVKEGKMVDITVTTGNTDTKAGWTQILTGYRPRTTGVFGNGRYKPIPEGYTIFERVEKALGKDKVYTAMIVGKKAHVDNDAPVRVAYDVWDQRTNRGRLAGTTEQRRLRGTGAKVVEENGQKYVETPGKPWYVAQNGMDLFRNGLGSNERVANLAMQTLEQHKADRMLLFIHFQEPDHVGHQSGESSAEYEGGIKADDEWTGNSLAKLKELGLADQTLVYIVADHGFDEGRKTHSKAPTVFCATNDSRINRDGNRADIAPTVLKRFGVDPKAQTPPLDGTPLDEPGK